MMKVTCGWEESEAGSSPSPRPQESSVHRAPQPCCTIRTLQCCVKQKESWGKAGDSVHWQQGLSLVIS